MKNRRLLIIVASLFSLSVQAQPIINSSVVPNADLVAPPAAQQLGISSPSPSTLPQSSRNPHAKITAAAFYNQSFASLPTGWTVSANSSSVNGWRWANTAPSGTGNNFPVIALINSTSKNDGWLLYNADSVINQSGSARPFGGSITSAAIAVGASHTNVMLSFQQYFRYSQGDSCFVDVSNNGSTWTAFPIYPNMALSQYGYLYSNATLTTLNVSSVIGGQANAYIRFRFNSTAAQYSFNWLIDDLMLYDADSTDLGIHYSGLASISSPNDGFTTSYGFSSIPLSLADTIFPITYRSNYGLHATTNTTITARYFLGSTLVNTQLDMISVTPLGAMDSVFVFKNGYKPTAIGNYVVALQINQLGDAFAQNDVDTIRFSVTDSAYATYGTDFMERTTYLSRPSSSTLQYWGARFTVGQGEKDTITSVSAAFRPNTAVGSRVQA
ncbi:MAG: hypothetical protein ABI378_04905, partial [Chitinophagaceae bacterium]